MLASFERDIIMKKCWIMLSCAVVLAGSATAATTWYVATDGDDINNDGLSAATPFAHDTEGDR